MKRFPCLLAVSAMLSLFIASPGFAAKSYFKWVDENGTTHYSAQPPKDTNAAKVKTTNLKGGEEADNSRSEESPATDKPATAAKPSEKSAENCEIVRKNLETLNTYGRIEVPDGDGKRFLSDDEIAQRKVEAQADINKYCN